MQSIKNRRKRYKACDDVGAATQISLKGLGKPRAFRRALGTSFIKFRIRSPVRVDCPTQKASASFDAEAFPACQRSLAIVQAFWYNGEKEDRQEEEWNSGNRITGETW